MAPRALWKAVLKLGSASVPVRLYSAVQDRTTHFHLLHESDHVRVHERMRRVDDESLVESADARSGYLLESGEVVLLDKKAQATLAPKPTRDIAVLHSVPQDRLPLAAFARPYWLGPDGADTDEYFALAQALLDEKVFAISEWVNRGKHHFGALGALEGRLILVELRSADQWLDTKGVQTPKASELNAREVSMAEQLIGGLDGEFDHARYHDSYHEQVAALVEAKAHGRKLPKTRAPRRSEPAKSLADALNQSLRALRKTGGSSKERKSA